MPSAEAQLTQIADAMLADAGSSPETALGEFVVAVRDNPMLVRALALAYLRARAAPKWQGAERVKRHQSQTVLDTFKVSDGRAIGDVQLHELPTLIRNSRRQAHVLEQIERHAAAKVRRRKRNSPKHGPS